MLVDSILEDGAAATVVVELDIGEMGTPSEVDTALEIDAELIDSVTEELRTGIPDSSLRVITSVLVLVEVVVDVESEFEKCNEECMEGTVERGCNTVLEVGRSVTGTM